MFTFDKALPEEMSVPSTAIRDLLLHLDEKNVPMHALLIMRKDKLIFEKYYAPYKADTQTAVFKQPGLIPISELSEILPTLNRISSWIEAVFAFVSSEAINHGVSIPGYKVVEGRSKRVFTDTKAVVDTAIANGYTDLYKQSLITLTEFEKMMGRKKFNELLGTYVAKPPGKLALVPESDPREAVDLTELSQEFLVLPDEE